MKRLFRDDEAGFLMNADSHSAQKFAWTLECLYILVRLLMISRIKQRKAWVIFFSNEGIQRIAWQVGSHGKCSTRMQLRVRHSLPQVRRTVETLPHRMLATTSHPQPWVLQYAMCQRSWWGEGLTQGLDLLLSYSISGCDVVGTTFQSLNDSHHPGTS